jgi:hypothetical protein
MAQACQCSEGKALHSVVHIRAPEGHAASALHGGRVGGQEGDGRGPFGTPLLSSRARRQIDSIMYVQILCIDIVNKHKGKK